MFDLRSHPTNILSYRCAPEGHLSFFWPGRKIWAQKIMKSGSTLTRATARELVQSQSRKSDFHAKLRFSR